MGAAQSAQHTVELDNDLWRFACAFYARDGVAPACLALQESLNVDVNILLFAIFARLARGVALDASDLGVVDALVRDWRHEIVQPLRRLRTRLKAGPAPAPSTASDHLRNRIKAAELEAEQIELALLAGWLDRRPSRPAASAAPIDAASVPLMVGRYFDARAVDAFPREAGDALAALSQAVREAAEESLKAEREN
jgi:uncharacterized protein (TIGR02444 family)